MAPILVKSLSRLSRDSLLDICLKWTKSSKCTPYLASNRQIHESEEEDYLHEPAESRDDLNDLYISLKENKTESDQHHLSKREIIDRIVDGDWRRGLSFQQLATLDFAYLEQNNAALRWSALKLVPMQDVSKGKEAQHPAKRRKISKPVTDEEHYPQISATSFLERLKAQVSPLVKAHYTMHRLPAPSNLAVIRLYIVPNTAFAPVSANVPRDSRAALDSARVMYIALPRSCPYVYVSVSGASTSKTKSGSKPDANKVDIANTKRIVLEAIPKALSKPHQRWSLESTKLTAKNLQSISLLRGNGRPGTSGGAYSKFNEDEQTTTSSRDQPIISTTAETSNSADSAPTSVQKSTTSIISAHETLVNQRFGKMTGKSYASLDRVNANIKNVLQKPIRAPSHPAASTNKSRKRRRRMTDIEDGETEETAEDSTYDPAPVTITFSGTDVFKGLRTLALQHPGCVDMDKVPAWLTGERNSSTLTV